MDIMTWDEWEDTYKPTTPLAYYDLEEVPADTHPYHLWTMINGEGRYANLVNGEHIIDRLGYFVTEVPWIDDVFVTDQKEMYA